jgi:hypothetical protein
MYTLQLDFPHNPEIHIETAKEILSAGLEFMVLSVTPNVTVVQVIAMERSTILNYLTLYTQGDTSRATVLASLIQE